MQHSLLNYISSLLFFFFFFLQTGLMKQAEALSVNSTGSACPPSFIITEIHDTKLFIMMTS